MDELIDTLIFELDGTSFVALANDGVVFDLGAVASAREQQSLDIVLGFDGKFSGALTQLSLASSRRDVVTLTSTARPRFSSARRDTFFKLPSILKTSCASWIRGVHFDADVLSVWIDFRLLADAVTGVPA
jgi:hypothetical protein